MKSIAKQFFIISGGTKFLRLLNHTPRVLFWHGVDNITDRNVELESVDISVFVNQIKYLQKYYEIISINEFYNRYKNKSFNNKEVVLTFDDGYANNLYQVAPFLNSLDIPFLVFISSQNITTGELFPTSIARLIIEGTGLNSLSIPSEKISFDISSPVLKKKAGRMVNNILKTSPLSIVNHVTQDLIENISSKDYTNLGNIYKSVKPMNWAEVRKLQSQGALIGPHCKSHICCHTNQDDKDIREQIIDSKRIIEQELSVECKYFAYPNGDYTDFSNDCVIEAGYKMGFTTEKKRSIIKSNSITKIPRIGVPGNYNTFRILVNLLPKE